MLFTSDTNRGAGPDSRATLTQAISSTKRLLFKPPLNLTIDSPGSRAAEVPLARVREAPSPQLSRAHKMIFLLCGLLYPLILSYNRNNVYGIEASASLGI